MITLYEGPPDAIAAPAAALQARAYASTGMRAWSAQEFISLLSNSCNRLYISNENSAPKTSLNGFLFATFIAGEAEILSLAVDTRHLRTGIASQLVEAMIRDCRREMIECIVLEVAQNNLPAMSLYISSGFEEVGHRPDYYALNGCYVGAHVLKRYIGSR